MNERDYTFSVYIYFNFWEAEISKTKCFMAYSLSTTPCFIRAYFLFVNKFVFLVLLFKRKYLVNKKPYTEIVHNKYIFFTISTYKNLFKLTW